MPYLYKLLKDTDELIIKSIINNIKKDLKNYLVDDSNVDKSISGEEDHQVNDFTLKEEELKSTDCIICGMPNVDPHKCSGKIKK